MKQFVLKITGYALACLIVLNGIAFMSLFILRKSDFYKPQFLKNGVAEKDFDYVVLGSSTGLTTLDTKLIDSITGKKGLNISMDDSGLSSHYLMLRHFYALHKKTKTLVLAISTKDMALTNHLLYHNDYRFLPDINTSYVYEYYKEMEGSNFKVLSISKYFPIAGVSYFNTEIFYSSILAGINRKKRNQFDDRGNYSYPVVQGPVMAIHKTSLLEFKNPYFFKIKQFCTDNNIELLLYLSPVYSTSVVTNGNPYQLINHSDLLTDPRLFYDDFHVNSNGRRICSVYFAKHLLAKAE